MKIEKAYFWPRWFFASLGKSERRKVSTLIIKDLCRANLYLWRALNLYDDFLDGEGVPKNLPLANNYYRHFLEIYYRLNLSDNFYKIFNRVITDLDDANRTEANAKKLKIKDGRIYYPRRLPTFNNLTALSRKSLALGLGSIAILDIISRKGKHGSNNLPQIKIALNFFRFALAAKQLSDDSCDWLDDLKAGSITPANALILKAAKKNRLILNYKKDPKTLYLLYIDEAAAKIAVGIASLCLRARREGTKIGLDSKSPLIKGLIEPMDRAIQKTKLLNIN
ncbi:MAG: hypothetical protein WC719_03070 [Patescibacteria group bacterium]|jgi:hypothetical protein